MEGLRLRPAASIIGISSPPIDIRSRHRTAVVSAIGGRSTTGPSSKAESQVAGNQSSVFQMRGMRLWPRREDEGNDEEEEEIDMEEGLASKKSRKGNWVMKILRIGSDLEGEKAESDVEEEEEEMIKGKIDDGDRCVGCCEGDEGCAVDYDGDDDDMVEIDKEVFSKLLRRVSLAKARSYARLSYLGSLAYSIKKIKPELRLKYRGLRYVTSSFEKRLTFSEENAEAREVNEEKKSADEARSSSVQKKQGISASSVYQIVASAASYVQSQTSNVLPFGLRNNGPSSDSETEILGVKSDIASPEEASFVVTTNSVTAVVAAKEEVKQAVADDLNTSRSSPCEWFVCDDDKSGTRYFVIQGSETLASWQANLLFEPVQFEGFDVLVHRGIYEAAKGIYEQMLPEIRAHLELHGKSATLCFTGHSLGGSLSLLVNLMLLIRQDAPLSALLPVITFGSPTIICGGNYLLQKLGLPIDHVQAITMHRDIVPRAFSCNYPDHVARILKTINKNFRSHPCLKHQKLLYEPMGEILILQPDEKFSPHHHLLPSGNGLYAMVHSLPELNESGKFLRKAKSVFFNSPHPLEILSDRSAYGSDGTVMRDHDMSSYLKCIRDVIGVELIRLRKLKRERSRKSKGVGIIIGWKSRYSDLRQINLSGVYQVGIRSMKQLHKLVVSRHVQMFLVLFLPMRFLLLKALAVINFS